MRHRHLQATSDIFNISIIISHTSNPWDIEFVHLYNSSFKHSQMLLLKYNIVMIKSRRLRWAGHVARMGERRGAYRILVGKPEGKETT
jgi:hypothetical protein